MRAGSVFLMACVAEEKLEDLILAAEGGDPNAQMEMGLAYHEGNERRCEMFFLDTQSC